jgi:hypothetical protein
MNIICLEEKAFYELIDKVVDHVKRNNPKEEKWISAEQTMKKLGITSRTTLQKFRDEGRIRFSQPERKIIRYDFNSINEL